MLLIYLGKKTEGRKTHKQAATEGGLTKRLRGGSSALGGDCGWKTFTVKDSPPSIMKM